MNYEFPPLMNVQHMNSFLDHRYLIYNIIEWILPNILILKRQVDELLRKGYIGENMSSSVVTTLLTLTKDWE